MLFSCIFSTYTAQDLTIHTDISDRVLDRYEAGEASEYYVLRMSGKKRGRKRKKRGRKRKKRGRKRKEERKEEERREEGRRQVEMFALFAWPVDTGLC